MKKILIPLIFLIAINACTSTKDESVTVIKHGPEKEYLIHLKEIKDSLTINFSDLARDFSFIPLETREECMLSSGISYVTSEYILIQKSKHGILQFDLQGRFIRTLIKVGKGPTEYTNVSWSVDENDQTLYLSDVSKMNYFLCFDLHSGKYLGDIKKAIPGKTGKIKIMKDKTILASRTAEIDISVSPYILYYQDTQGNIISGISTDSNQNIQYTDLFYGNNNYNYLPNGETGIYSIDDDTIKPYIRINYGEKNPDDIAVGNKTISVNFETREYFKFMKNTVGSVSNYPEGGGYYSISSSFYVLDKKGQKAYVNESIYSDPTGHFLEIYETYMVKVQDNGIFHYTYQAIDLLQQAKKALNDPDFKEPYRTQLRDLVEGLSENDNPVLLIGKLL